MNNNQMLMGQFQTFIQNPAAFVAQRMNIPQNILNNPNAIIQYMMNNGMLSQAQFNQLDTTARGMLKNPDIARFLRR